MPKFTPNKPFVIMQIADVQDGPEIAADTLKLIAAALDKTSPDIVVLTGDQVHGLKSPFRDKKNGAERMRGALHQLLKPIVERGIAFAPTFGNHDAQGLPAETGKTAQMSFYKELQNCLAPSVDGDCGTYSIPIQSSDGTKTALNIYIVDSGSSVGAGYEPVKPEQLAWYRRQRDELALQNGAPVPSMVFQHIPVPEYYDVLLPANKKDEGAIRAFRSFNGYWTPNMDKIYQFDYMEESCSCPDENTGEFDALTEKGEVFAMSVGHDHKNSWAARHDRGVHLVYCPGAGFNTYGAGIDRAVRIFEFDEDNPRDFRTYTLRYRDIVGTKVEKPLKDYINSHSPTNVSEGIELGFKILGFLFGLAAIAAELVWLFGR
ncbi:MAG: metallophosphoesterase family protein [Oscillospiraceae bacterium]|nr:metallophosphoesterase family protein [Oscillospiraceae bacterium]